MPPGSRALAFANRWFAPATVHATFAPLIADWQREWVEAPQSRRTIVLIKGAVAFCVAAVVSMPAIVRTPAPKSLTVQIVRRVAITAAIGTILLMLPFAQEFRPLPYQGLMALVVVPQALTLIFPFALLPGVDAIRRFDGVDSHAARATLSKLAVLGMAFVFVCHGWITPAANQAWRELSFRAAMEAGGPEFARHTRGPAKGVRELTTYELISATTLAAGREPGTYVDPVTRVGTLVFSPKSVRVEIHNRATLAVLPVFLLWRRWRALDLPSGRWWSPRHPVVATIAAFVLFMSLRGFFNSVEHAWLLPAGSGAWVGLAVLAMIGMIRVGLVERTVARA